MQRKPAKGFTLIELLIVIGIITILASVVFVTIDPAARLQSARDVRRETDVENVAGAIISYQVDNDSDLPPSVEAMTTGSAYMIGTATSGCNSGCTATSTQASCADLTVLQTDGYLGSIPEDPSSGTPETSLYYLMKNTNGSITVAACTPEGSTAISTTR